jgi:hypothetical protein
VDSDGELSESAGGEVGEPVGFVNSVVADLQGNRAGAGEARLADRVAAVKLAMAAPPILPWSRAADATRRAASLPEHQLDRELHQRRQRRARLAVTGHPDAAEKSLATARAPTRVALLCPPALQRCGREGRPRFRISLEIGDDRVYEP